VQAIKVGPSARWQSADSSAAAAGVTFRFRSLGSMVGICLHNVVDEILGIRMTGLPAWLLWRAFCQAQMPTLGRKARIYVE
jgi:NADH dehydrogenase